MKEWKTSRKNRFSIFFFLLTTLLLRLLIIRLERWLSIFPMRPISHPFLFFLLRLSPNECAFSDGKTEAKHRKLCEPLQSKRNHEDHTQHLSTFIVRKIAGYSPKAFTFFFNSSLLMRDTWNLWITFLFLRSEFWCQSTTFFDFLHHFCIFKKSRQRKRYSCPKVLNETCFSENSNYDWVRNCYCVFMKAATFKVISFAIHEMHKSIHLFPAMKRKKKLRWRKRKLKDKGSIQMSNWHFLNVEMLSNIHDFPVLKVKSDCRLNKDFNSHDFHPKILWKWTAFKWWEIQERIRHRDLIQQLRKGKTISVVFKYLYGFQQWIDISMHSNFQVKEFVKYEYIIYLNLKCMYKLKN